MLTSNQLLITQMLTISLLSHNEAFSAGLDTLSKAKPPVEASPAAEKPATSSTNKPASASDQAGPAVGGGSPVALPIKPAPVAPPAPTPKAVTPPKKAEESPDDAAPSATLTTKQTTPQSPTSKTLENRLSLATSLGWAMVKPSKGTWAGIGASDVSARWRESHKGDGNLFITARYSPIAGVWTVDERDYDTTLHGIFGGAEYQKPIEFMGSPTIKAGVELGYLLVYARPQDQAEAADDVKGGSANLAAGADLDWDILNGKVKAGPFVRMQVIGFSLVNLGGSINFVF